MVAVFICFCQIFESFRHHVFQYSPWTFCSILILYLSQCYVSLAFEALFIFFIPLLLVSSDYVFLVGQSKIKCRAFCFFSHFPFLLLLLTIKHLLKLMYLIEIFYNTHFTNAPQRYLSTNSIHYVLVMHGHWRFFFFTLAIGLWWNTDFLKCLISQSFSLCRVIFYRVWGITSMFW